MRLIDAFPNWLTNGIFHKLQFYDIPWKDEDISLVLDMEYFGNVSGEKLVSPLISKLLTGSELSDWQITQLADLLYGIYGPNWTKEWATLTAEYNPIENYHMVETMTDDETVTDYGKRSTRTDNLSHGKTGTEALLHGHTDTRTDNLTHAKTGTEALQHGHTDTRTDNLTHTKSGTETVREQITNESTDNVFYGFNSANAVDQSGTDHTKDGTNTTTYNVTETGTGTSTHANTGTDTTTYNLSETDTGTSTHANTGTDTTTFNLSETDTGTVGNVDSGTDTTTRNYELERSGNIGVTTSQQMLQSERDLWLWNYFYKVVFPDIDRVLTIPYYSGKQIETGSSFTPEGTIDITQNGTVNVYAYASADVNVPNTYNAVDEGKVVVSGELVTQTSRAIVANGDYNTLTNSLVIVDVPNTYTTADEGKVVSNGALVSQSSDTVTQNDTYNTTLINSLTVNVPVTDILSGTDAPSASLGSDGAIYLQYEDECMLPSGYTHLESVEFTGTQAVDTGISVATQSLRVVSKIAITSIGTEAIWGGSWSESGFFLMVYNEKFRWHSRGKSVDSASIVTSRWYEVETNKSALIVDGYEYALANPTGTEVSTNLQIGSVSNSQGSKAHMRCKRTKVYDGSTLLADLIPAKDSNDVACLYDTVSSTTFYGSGGDLVANETVIGKPIDSAYLKVNGAWQNLIGSDIDDVI